MFDLFSVFLNKVPYSGLHNKAEYNDDCCVQDIFEESLNVNCFDCLYPIHNSTL